MNEHIEFKSLPVEVGSQVITLNAPGRILTVKAFDERSAICVWEEGSREHVKAFPRSVLSKPLTGVAIDP